jgi:hypothetical protein
MKGMDIEPLKGLLIALGLAAVLVAIIFAAYASAQGLTAPDMLNQIFGTFGGGKVA